MPQASLLDDVAARPASALLVLLQTAVWAYLWNYRIDVALFAYQYDKVVTRRQYWRCVSASLAHVSPLHLVFNMASTWQLGAFETIIGTAAYLRESFLLLFLSMFVVTLCTHVRVLRGNIAVRSMHSLGYSCVGKLWRSGMLDEHVKGSFLFFYR